MTRHVPRRCHRHEQRDTDAVWNGILGRADEENKGIWKPRRLLDGWHIQRLASADGVKRKTHCHPSLAANSSLTRRASPTETGGAAFHSRTAAKSGELTGAKPALPLPMNADDIG